MIHQFDVFANPDSASAAVFPFLAVLQSNAVEGTRSVIAAPLVSRPASMRSERIQPVFTIEGRNLALIVSDLAAVPRSVLKAPVANISPGRDEIMAALDLPFIGF